MSLIPPPSEDRPEGRPSTSSGLVPSKAEGRKAPQALNASIAIIGRIRFPPDMTLYRIAFSIMPMPLGRYLFKFLLIWASIGLFLALLFPLNLFLGRRFIKGPQIHGAVLGF